MLKSWVFRSRFLARVRVVSLLHNLLVGSGSLTAISSKAKEVSPKVKRTGPQAEYSPPSSTEVKNEWSYISTPLLVFMSCTRTSLPLTSPFISCLLDGLWKGRVCLYVKWVVAQTDCSLPRISTHPCLRKHTVSALLYRLSYRTVICIFSSICLSPFFRCCECISNKSRLRQTNPN